jgi:crotonobetaine/carnitine-CoA ligase
VPETIADLVEAAASSRGDRPWLHFGPTVISFEEAAERANGVAEQLADLGVQPGDVVASDLTNSPEAIFVWFGLMQLGALHLPLNPRATAFELAGTLAHAQPVVVVTEPATAEVMTDALRELPIRPTRVSASEVTAARSPKSFRRLVRAEDPAVLIQTSGSTGMPKLVLQSHRAYVMTAEGFPHWIGLTPDDHMLTCLPLFHLNAQAYSTLGSLGIGARFTLLERFSLSTYWDSVRRAEATQVNVIGAMIEMFRKAPPGPQDRAHQVRIMFGGPTPDRERHLAFERRFGLTLTSGYALSECPYGTVWPRDEPAPYGSIGRLRQHPELGEVNAARVVDDREQPVPDGTAGELLLRNPAVMLGYYRLPEETAAVLRDGWLRTGDLVRRDDTGIYHFLGRKREVIRRRGENLSPREVEAVIEAHPEVAECAVVGVPSEVGEEDVKVFVRRAEGGSVSAEALQDWSVARLSAFKVPRYVEFVEDFPRTPTNRIAKHRLPRERTPAEVRVAR